MYIRWKEKPRTPQWGYDEHHRWRRGAGGHKATLWSAYLVESARREGKPRQRTTYLASIQDVQVEDPTHRLHFWKTVEKKLSSLQLSTVQQHTLRRKLLERVPEVSREQLELANREMTQALAQVNAFPQQE